MWRATPSPTTSPSVSFRPRSAEASGQRASVARNFQALGLWLVVDAVADPQTLGFRSWVNGEPRQDSNSDMIFTVTTLIEHLSQFMARSPGDVINTDTPQGVALSGRFPYLKAGDFMELEIDGLGRQRQELTTAQA